MDLNLPLQFIIIVVIDAVVLLLLFLILLRKGGAKNNMKQEEFTRLEHLQRSLRQAMDQSGAVSQELLDAMAEKTEALQEVLEKLQSKERQLSSTILRAEVLVKSIDEKENPFPRESQDPYQKALELLSRGSLTEEIHQQCGLAQGEIDLMRGIFSHQP